MWQRVIRLLEEGKEADVFMMSKMLIIYYSSSNGNTRRIAKRLQKATNADIVQIETVRAYEGSC